MQFLKVGGEWINSEAIDRIEVVDDRLGEESCNLYLRGGQVVAIHQTADSVANDLNKFTAK